MGHVLCQPLAQTEPGLASCGHHTADTSAPSLGLQPLLLGQTLALRSLVPQAPASFVLKSDPVVDYWGEGWLWGWVKGDTGVHFPMGFLQCHISPPQALGLPSTRLALRCLFSVPCSCTE